jgi:lipopolysaccharide export system permease protein
MRKINRYISRSVTGAISMVLLVIMALMLISGFIDEIGSVRGNYTFTEMLIYVGLTMPRRLYEIIPFACLIGCLIGLGILANSSELVIMRAAGISVKRITWMVLKPVSLFILFGIFLGEFVTPYTDQVSESRRAIALEKRTADAREGSMWNREGDEYMRFNAVLPRGVLYGVTRYKFDSERNLLEASFSKQAIYQGGYWQEEDILVTHFEQAPIESGPVGESEPVAPEPGANAGNTTAATTETAVTAGNGNSQAANSQSDIAGAPTLGGALVRGTRNEQIQTRRWETPLSPGLLNILVAEPEALSLRSLRYYIKYLKEQNLISSDYSLAFWQKLLQPLATASLVLIAISFIFGPLREVTMGQRIFTGVVFGVVFRLTQDLLGPSSVVFGFAPLIAVMVPIGFCLALGIYLLNRTR